MGKHYIAHMTRKKISQFKFSAVEIQKNVERKYEVMILHRNFQELKRIQLI